MKDIKYLFPQGKSKAFTLSYDDGVLQDFRLVEIFNKFNLKATFNLNSGIQSEDNFWMANGTAIRRINKSEIHDLYKGHEVAVHSLTHPSLADLPRELIVEEVLKDKENLEELFGYSVRGMAYPYGTYNQTVIEVLRELGIEYSRTVHQHESFELPEEPLEWKTTCHHKNPKLMELADSFVNSDSGDLSLFYVWGHSYEFDLDNNWELIEKFCKQISNRSDIWYATNIEIIDYIKAQRKLEFSDDFTEVTNPSETVLWIGLNDSLVEIKPGERIKL